MKQAVIQTGGKQYLVHEGQTLKVERLAVEQGQTVTFDEVLAVIDGEATQVGAPTVAGVKVEATVKENGRHDKIRVEKFKRKVNYHRTMGHQQHYTELTIAKIA